MANDKTENFLFHNNRNGTFTEVAVRIGCGVWAERRKYIRHGTGVCGFREHRAAWDLWITDSKYNRLLRNSGT